MNKHYLHGQLVASVRSAVDDIESRNWHQNVLDAIQVGNVAVERTSCIQVYKLDISIFKLFLLEQNRYCKQQPLQSHFPYSNPHFQPKKRCQDTISIATFVGSSSFASSHGNTENSICAQVALVVRAIKLQHQVINCSLERVKINLVYIFNLNNVQAIIVNSKTWYYPFGRSL